MKRWVIVLGTVLLAGFVAYPVFAHGPGRGWGGGHHMMGYWGGGSDHCWEYDRGYGRGSGIMGRGYSSEQQYQQSQRPLEESDIKAMIDDYLRSTRNPNLKLGEIKDKDSVFEADILTRDGSLADKIAVDKETGSMRSVY